MVGILDDGDAAAFLDDDQAGGAIIEHGSQNRADDARPVRYCRRAEQRVDAGPVTVFSRALCDRHCSCLAKWKSDRAI